MRFPKTRSFVMTYDNGYGGEYEFRVHVQGGRVTEVEPLGWDPTSHAWDVIEELAAERAGEEEGDWADRMYDQMRDDKLTGDR